MIAIGTWIGNYKFDSEAVNKARGFEFTDFEITIERITKNNFTGIVQDNVKAGGTEGVGKIDGKVVGDKIEFIKRMPIMTLLIDNKGTRKTFNKKHRPIYYSGTISKDNRYISGNWKFKPGFIWFGFLPIFIKSTKGTWEMKMKN